MADRASPSECGIRDGLIFSHTGSGLGGSHMFDNFASQNHGLNSRFDGLYDHQYIII